MFPMIDGLPITESKLYDPKHPYEQRDPRLYETVVVNGDKYYGGIAEIYVGGKHYQDFEGSYGAFMSGYRPRNSSSMVVVVLCLNGLQRYPEKWFNGLI